MKTKRILALLMSVATMITMFAACSKDEGEDKETTAAAGEQTTAAAEAEAPAVDITKGFTATKVGSYKLKAEYEAITPSGCGAEYEGANGKYGIVSADGKHDTGAVYTICKAHEGYFSVTDWDIDAIKASNANCFGLADETGKLLIPMEYYYTKRINDTYYKAIKITGTTTKEEEGLMYVKDNPYQLGREDDDTLLKGNWCIYNIETGKAIPGASGTKAYRQTATGKILEYTTDDGTKKKVGPDGNTIPADAKILSNDSYYINDGANKAVVYDASGNKLFEYAGEGYIYIYEAGDGCYMICDGSQKYFIVDKSGKAISAEFERTITVCEELLISNGKVYDYDGNLVLDGDYSTIEKDETSDSWYLSGNDGYALIKKDGTVIYKCKKNEGITLYSSNMIIQRDSDSLYYSFADEDFTIKGYSCAPWLVKASSDDYSSTWIVDTISGKKIIEGYRTYNSFVVNGTIYIHATDESGNVDVYKVS